VIDLPPIVTCPRDRYLAAQLLPKLRHSHSYLL